MTSQDIAELYVEELTAHPAKHGLDLWLSKGFTFGRLPSTVDRGSRHAGPILSTMNAPTRGRVGPGNGRFLKHQIHSRTNVLADNLTGVRAIVADMRRRGAAAAAVQRYVVRETPFTLRQVFRACSDAFEIACYSAE